MSALTPAQLRVCKAIHLFWLEHHYAPSIRDLLIILGRTGTQSVIRLVTVCQAKGYVTRQPHLSRTMQVTAKFVAEYGGDPCHDRY